MVCKSMIPSIIRVT